MTVEPTKVCAGCRERKVWSEFWPKVKWDDGTMRQPHARCKDCARERTRERQRERRQRNPEETRAADRRQYRKTMSRAASRAKRREIVRRAKRKQFDIPPERWRVHPVDGEAQTFLPIGPFREWLLDQIERLGSMAVLADALGLDDKTIRRWLDEHDRVHLDHADRAFCRLDEPQLLRELYPAIYDAPEVDAA